MFVINDIISIEEAAGKKRSERILWIDEGNIICYTIDMDKKSKFPIKRKISDLQQLHGEQLLSLIDSDPYGFIYQDEEQLSEKSKDLRDARWECIKDMVLQEPDIFERDKRGRLITAAIAKTGKSKRLLYKYLVQYWRLVV